MASSVTIRLDHATRQRISRIAKGKRTSASHVIREVIEAGLQRREAALSPYALVADLVGSLNGGDPKRSEGGVKFAEILRQRRSHSQFRDETGPQRAGYSRGVVGRSV